MRIEYCVIFVFLMLYNFQNHCTINNDMFLYIVYLRKPYRHTYEYDGYLLTGHNNFWNGFTNVA